ncbi:hypothetical protein GCM10027280_45530 [Micromonospora polyrhachis]|uniref:Uncharacterized protein n=1 Tax=Micromonospora polyrhachis TaxID=1282883 RepID=A0A7W7SQ88_9ACTN|nr:hypothetical protein [Micromonospora polyrhachis]MBB4958934.1 hypothetical protein [Micromonospora polyrhachis]
MTTQLELFATTAPVDGAPLTVADLDEWIAVTRNVANSHAAGHYPFEWARAGLGALLGEVIPHRRWSTRELLDALARARQIAAKADVDDRVIGGDR